MLRFRADDPNAKTPLGAKFGCSIPLGKSLLNTAKDHHLNVIGIRYRISSKSRRTSKSRCPGNVAASIYLPTRPNKRRPRNLATW